MPIHKISEFKSSKQKFTGTGALKSHAVQRGTLQGTNQQWIGKKIGATQKDELDTRLEALAQEFFRLIIPHQPETRIAKNDKTGMFYILSEEANGYKNLPYGEQKQFSSGVYTGLGQVLICATLLEENDLKNGNIGLDNQNRVIKIDGDWCFSSLKKSLPQYSINTNTIDMLPVQQTFSTFNWLDLRQEGRDAVSSIVAPHALRSSSHFKREKHQAMMKIALLPKTFLEKFVHAYMPNNGERILNIIQDHQMQLRMSTRDNPGFNEYLKTPAAKQDILEMVHQMMSFKVAGIQLLKGQTEADIIQQITDELTKLNSNANTKITFDECFYHATEALRIKPTPETLLTALNNLTDLPLNASTNQRLELQSLIESIIKQGTRPTEKMLADVCMAGKINVAKLLIKYGAPPSPQMLLNAYSNGKIRVAELLINQGVSPDLPMLEALCEDNKIKGIRDLIEQKIAPTQTLYKKFCTREHLQTLKVLLDSNVAPSLALLKSALESSELSVAQLLLNKTLDVNIATYEEALSKGLEPNREMLNTACLSGNMENINWFIQKGIEPTVNMIEKMLNNKVPPSAEFMDIACKEGDSKVINLLISKRQVLTNQQFEVAHKNGAKPSIQMFNMACEKGDLSLIEQLMTQGLALPIDQLDTAFNKGIKPTVAMLNASILNTPSKKEDIKELRKLMGSTMNMQKYKQHILTLTQRVNNPDEVPKFIALKLVKLAITELNFERDLKTIGISKQDTGIITSDLSSQLASTLLTAKPALENSHQILERVKHQVTANISDNTSLLSREVTKIRKKPILGFFSNATKNLTNFIKKYEPKAMDTPAAASYINPIHK